MKKIFIKRFKDVSISRKLYFTIGIMAFLIVIELGVLGFAINTLSAVRSYVAGEGLWSKAQKDAISNLRLYAYSHDEKDYRKFREFLNVPLGDGKARAALEKEVPDYAMARQGFLEGRNHPDDIDDMINLMLRFNQNKYLKKTIFFWKKAEASMLKLIPISEQLHEAVLVGQISVEETNQILNYIDKVNTEATPLEDNFSYTLGEGSRFFEQLVLKLLLALALTVETTGIIIAISISRGIQKGLNSIIEGAELFSTGTFNTRVKVYSGDEIGTLALAFNKMADNLEQTVSKLKESEIRIINQKNKAEASEKIKQIFIANVSHEIRTPMNAITGFAQLLNESQLEEEQEEYVKAIVKSSKFLQILLNNMLDLSKIEAGRVVLEKKPIDILEIVNTAVAMLRSDAQKKNLSISYSVDEKLPLTVLGDEVRLSQILLNLITNAIKYTPAGSVFVQVKLDKETNSAYWLEFSVQDTGVGIPKDKHGKIFEIFEQLAHDREFGGIGLGLSIVKQLVALQGGKIYIKNSTSQGTDFRFLIPFDKNETLALDSPLNTTTVPPVLKVINEKEINVLVADDNSLNQLLISKVLKKSGFNVDVAADGLSAVKKHEINKYAVILMDLDMPEMNGYEATQAIRNSSHPNRNIPIIAITAHATPEVREKCMTIGMDDFITKPFQSEDLFQKILKHIK